MITDLSIIIPVHEYTDEDKTLLKRAISTVPEGYEIRISCSKGLGKSIKASKLGKNVTVYESTTDATDFCSLVNQAIEGTKWFSILEFDDEYTDIWFHNVERYMEYNPEVSVYMPLEDIINYTDNKYLNFGNEAAWASAFSNEIGYLDNDCLQQFFDFYMTGAVFNTADWQKYGGLKPSIKVSFWYEFLLRLTYNHCKIFVIPKIGYRHYVNRPNSLYVQYRKDITEKESAWWFDLAKQEYFFSQDRNKQYQENNDKEGE